MAFFLLFTACWPSAASAGGKKVLVVNSYHEDYQWVVAHNTAFEAHMGWKVNVGFQYLDTKRLPRDEYMVKVEEAWALIEKVDPDVVVLTDDNAVMFLGGRAMDAGIPVVFLGINENPRRYLGAMELATGVLERPLFKRSLFFLKDIIGPSLERCLVLFDDSTTAQVIMDTIFKGKTSFTLADTEVDIKLIDTYDHWQQSILGAERYEYDIIFTGLYHTLADKEGNVAHSEEVIRWTSANTPVPIFGYWDFAVGKGMAVGGLVNSGELQGREAAKLVLRILAGENPKDIYPVTAENGVFMFSQHELDRWGLKLPEDFAPSSDPVRMVK